MKFYITVFILSLSCLMAHAATEGGASDDRFLAARDAAWAAFRADPEWQAAAAASEVGGKLTAKVESVYLTMTDYSPALRLGQ